MYGKIFSSIYDGTLAEDWRALITFQQMIVLCDADGVVDMTVSAISRRTGIPIEHIKAGIEILQNPDPCSRTPNEDGRRINLLDEHRPWGWYIVNHETYKTLKDSDTVRAQNRDRKRRQRERDKQVTDCHAMSQNVTDSHTESRHTDTDTNTDTIKTLVETPAGVSPCPHQEIIKLYHEVLPELPRIVVKRWSGSKRWRDLQSRWREDKAHQDFEFWHSFFEVVRTNPHWMGQNERGWKADLGWLLKRTNFDKVIERWANQ